MPHTVYADNGDHYFVFGDYSGSKRHLQLSEVQWQSEYANDAAYQEMRDGAPGSVAGVTPMGVGRWKKDWSGPYVAPSVRLVISSNGTLDFDGTLSVAADGTATHTMTIKKVDQDGNDVASGSEAVRLVMSAPIPVSESRPDLSGGQVSIVVGPCVNVCDMQINAVDPTGILKPGTIKIRFS